MRKEQLGITHAPAFRGRPLKSRRQQFHLREPKRRAPRVRESRWKRPPRLPNNRPREESAKRVPNGSTRLGNDIRQLSTQGDPARPGRSFARESNAAPSETPRSSRNS